MKIARRTSKRAVSPVLATVILIAITLVAATAVAGFVFGLLGTFTNSALVSASASPLCSGTPETCSVLLTNSGSENTVVAGTCTLNFGGSSYLGTVSVLAGSLAGGQTESVNCVSNTLGSHAVAGFQLTGSILLANGANVLFSTTAT